MLLEYTWEDHIKREEKRAPSSCAHLKPQRSARVYIGATQCVLRQSLRGQNSQKRQIGPELVSSGGCRLDAKPNWQIDRVSRQVGPKCFWPVQQIYGSRWHSFPKTSLSDPSSPLLTKCSRLLISTISHRCHLILQSTDGLWVSTLIGSLT